MRFFWTGVMIAIIAVVTLLALNVATAGAQVAKGVGTTVTKLCVYVEQVPNHYYTNGDLNVKHGSKRICIEGKQGRRGRTGQTGATGAAGEAGQAGAQGEVGPQGPAGPEGPAGPQGPAGEDGQDGTITFIEGTVAVCASVGGNLKVCDGDEGHDAIGYLALVSG